MNFRQKCLNFAIICFFLSANAYASAAYDQTIDQLDFSKSVKIELNLVSEKYLDAYKLCQLKSSHKWECQMKFSISSNKKEYGEANLKIQSNFTRAELEDLIQTTKKEFETYGKFTVTLQQETSAK